ncbi:phosphodiesterase [Aquirhabdus sp.]|uniref:phosphodiesterase n=1 Tax=Aquirhabdus sp. TaxID=2824160 RepID=UPI00396C99C2
MIVLSHRGYWLEPSEKNKTIAFTRSFDLMFGTETDVRDCGGKLVISHDMPSGQEMSLTDFLALVGQNDLPLALNIKADGLVHALKEIMQSANISNWFVFDMSIPDMRSYMQANVPVFVRMSDVEREPAWLDQVQGIWLDNFSDKPWYEAGFIENLLNSGKRVCIVSPELHGQSIEPLWNLLLPISQYPNLMICTDYPERARQYFGEKI